LCRAKERQDVGTLNQLCSSFNFGPPLGSNREVRDVVSGLLQHYNGTWRDSSTPGALHEAGRLNLSIEKAYHVLKWSPAWDFARTIEETARWYLRAAEGGVREFTQAQISHYLLDAGEPAS
jgi:CDP-glucose 4,6-dehydratase